MKRTIISALTIAMFLFAAYVFAQDAQEEPAQAQRRGGRQNMMGQQRMGMMRQNMTPMRGQATTGMGRQGMGMTPMGGMRGAGGNRMQATRPGIGGDDLYLSLRDVLELDDSQVDKLKKIRVENIELTGELETDLKVAQLELRDLLDEDTQDMDAIEDKIRDIHEYEAKLEVAKLRVRADAKAVLTPEQLEKVSSAPRAGGMMRGMGGRRN